MQKLVLSIAFLFFSKIISLAQEPTVNQVLENYYKAIGGNDRISKIVSISIESEVKIQGMTEKVVAHKKNGKLVSTGTIEGMGEVEKIVCNGKMARVTAGGRTQEVEGNNLKLFLSQTAIIAEQDYEKNGIKGEFKGIEKLEEKEAYLIKWNSEIGSWTDYYDVNSGLKILQVIEAETPQGKMTTEISFKEYKDFDGVLFPTIQKTSNGLMELEVKILKIELNKDLNDEIFDIF